MNKIKKIIICLVIMIIVTILMIIVLNSVIGKNNINKYMYFEDEFNEEDSVVKLVTDTNTYFNLKDYAENYYIAVQNLWYENDSSQVFADKPPQQGMQKSDYYAEFLYNVLGSEYIEEYNITIEKIGEIYKPTNKMETVINNIYSYDISSKLQVYFIEGYNWEFKTSAKNDVNLIIAVNRENAHFAIYPLEYLKKLGINDLKIGEKLNIKEDDFKITQNNYNSYKEKIKKIDEVILEYVNLYKFNVNYDKEAAYELLNKEYRDLKFGNIDEYKKYLKNNMQTIQVNKYAKSTANNYTQYVCMTSNEKYFIINETAPMKFTIMLDPYTINLQTFIEEYDNVSNTNKVALNIEKVKKAINDKDYKYVYNKLNETYKQNNYPTLESFENYIKINFFEKNEFECEDIDEQNNAYVFAIKATSTIDENAESKSINVIMKLKSGTDFEMSFGK